MEIKILFAIPSYDGSLKKGCIESLFKCFKHLEYKNIQYNFKIFSGSLIVRVRNEIAHYFIKSEYTHLFFIDADIGNYHKVLKKMLLHIKTKRVIGGIYPKKQFENFLLAFNVNNKQPLFETATNFNVDLNTKSAREALIISNMNNGIMKVKHIATGCLMINKNVFLEIKEDVPIYKDVFSGEIMRNYFGCLIENETFLSEDYSFCHLLNKKHIDIWAIVDINLEHEGAFNYKGNYKDYLKKYNIIKNNF